MSTHRGSNKLAIHTSLVTLLSQFLTNSKLAPQFWQRSPKFPKTLFGDFHKLDALSIRQSTKTTEQVTTKRAGSG